MRYQWEIFASPVAPGETGRRWFWVSEGGVIRATENPEAPDPRTDETGAWAPID